MIVTCMTGNAAYHFVIFIPEIALSIQCFYGIRGGMSRIFAHSNVKLKIKLTFTNFVEPYSNITQIFFYKKMTKRVSHLHNITGATVVEHLLSTSEVIIHVCQQIAKIVRSKLSMYSDVVML